jgi:YesN/AraC family two-component response regulator
MMPEMDGIELSKKIKLNSATSHIPMIILTAKSAAKDKMEGYETGADEYIIKPYDEDFLKTRIKNLLKGRKLLKQKFVNNSLLNPKELSVNSKDQTFLENLYKSLEENLQSNNLKADVISKNLNMSHSSMYKKIKSLMGLTYMEFIRDYRLSIAKQLIEEMGYSVSEACYKVGYSDRKYFSKLFKNKFKQNPSFYLKS